MARWNHRPFENAVGWLGAMMVPLAENLHVTTTSTISFLLFLSFQDTQFYVILVELSLNRSKTSSMIIYNPMLSLLFNLSLLSY